MAHLGRCAREYTDFTELQPLSRNRVRHFVLIRDILLHAEGALKREDASAILGATTRWYPEGTIALKSVYTSSLPYIKNVPFTLTLARNDADTVILVLSALVQNGETAVVVDTLTLADVPSGSKEECLDALHTSLKHAFFQYVEVEPESMDD